MGKDIIDSTLVTFDAMLFDYVREAFQHGVMGVLCADSNRGVGSRLQLGLHLVIHRQTTSYTLEI